MGFPAQTAEGPTVYIVSKKLIGDTEILTDQDGREFVLNTNRKLVPYITEAAVEPETVEEPETTEVEPEPITMSDMTTQDALDDLAALQRDAAAGDEDAKEGLDLIEAKLDADDTLPDGSPGAETFKPDAA